MTTQILYRNNDHLIRLTGLQDSITDAYVNDATVTVTIKDLDGNEVAGISWPVTMDYEATSDGDYRATLDKAIVLAIGKRYTAEITVASGTRDAFFELPIQAQIRES